jgi:hypothetical protein
METIAPSELLELAGFSSLVYDCYLIHNEADGEEEKKVKNKKKRKNKENQPLDENKKINIETGMRFNALLKQQQ